ncbi:MAG: ABC transporter ATP-binding protein [Chloroflexota bacterium]
MALIETRELWQRREGRDILKNVNIRVDRGEVFALIGATGAGKTTLLRVIDLLDPPTSGRVFYDGADVTASEKLKLETRRRMAYVLQKPVVFNTSVYDNVAYGLKWRGVAGRQLHERVGDILEMVELTEYRNRNARTLSGGEVQRVAIARAVATGPEVLLLDEPTANLDPLSEARIEELIAGIIRRDAITVIMATHDMGQGQRLADRISVLAGGEIVQTGVPREIFNRPKNREVAEFVGMENIIDGVIESCEGEIAVVDINGRLIEAVADCDVGQEVAACLRPEDVTVALAPISSSARNCLEGTVVRTVVTGPVCRVEIDCGFSLVAMVTRRSSEELGLKKGRKVYATFKAVNVHIINH